MGVIKNIKHNEFPKQSKQVNRKVTVYFHYDTDNTVGGVIIRDDVEEPYLTIFKLGDGRHILSTECQYSID